MYSTLKRAKWPLYAITLVVAFALFSRSGFRTIHILDDFFHDYGVDGHIVILIVSVVIAFYLGFKNVYGKWLYPLFVACFVYFVIPVAVFIFNPHNRFVDGLAFWLFYAFTRIFLPHLVIPLLGLLLGKLIWKINIV